MGVGLVWTPQTALGVALVPTEPRDESALPRNIHVPGRGGAPTRPPPGTPHPAGERARGLAYGRADVVSAESLARGALHRRKDAPKTNHDHRGGRYKDRVDFEPVCDCFHDVIAAAVRRLVKTLEDALAPALTAMDKTNWGALELVDEESLYVRDVRARAGTDRLGQSGLESRQNVAETFRSAPA